jgi:type I restriction enzyme S subunit
VNWPEVPIGELVNIRGGGTPERRNESFFQGDIPWVTPKDMKRWEIIDSQIKITLEAINQSAANLIPADTVLLVVRSGVLKHTAPIAINRRPIAINQDMKSLQCSDRLLPEYLARYLKDSEPIILSWVRATTADNYSIDNIRQFPIPLPPLEEQRRIAAILDQADDLRRKWREAAHRLYLLGPAIFIKAFGSPRLNPFRFKHSKLGDIINFIGGSQPPKSTFLYEDGPNLVRFVQIRDFTSDEYKTYIPASLAKRPFETDDVMIGRYGPPVFQIFRGLSGSYNVALMKAEPRLGILKDFVYYLLQERELHSFVVANSERTAGQSGVNLALLDTYPAYIPPLEMQQKFAAQIANIENLKTHYSAHLAKLDALFASLQHRAFRGEL